MPIKHYIAILPKNKSYLLWILWLVDLINQIIFHVVAKIIVLYSVSKFLRLWHFDFFCFLVVCDVFCNGTLASLFFCKVFDKCLNNGFFPISMLYCIWLWTNLPHFDHFFLFLLDCTKVKSNLWNTVYAKLVCTKVIFHLNSALNDMIAGWFYFKIDISTKYSNSGYKW